MMPSETEEYEHKQPDLGTLQGAKEYLNGLFSIVSQLFATRGSLDPVHFLFITVDPNTGEPLGEAQVLVVANEDAMANESSKTKFSIILKELVKTTHSVGIVQVMEVWTVRSKPGDTGVTLEEYQRLRRTGMSVQHMPGAYEAVTVMMEHRRAKGPYLYTAKIVRDAEGKGTLMPFEAIQDPEQSESGRAEGRFAGYFAHLS